VVGSDRQLLIRQFLAESVILSLIGLTFALIIVELSLPWFNRTMALNLRLEPEHYFYLLPLFFFLAIMVGLLSGIYPALFMARFKIWPVW
jgi:putative ABC transport system permease protein